VWLTVLALCGAAAACSVSSWWTGPGPEYLGISNDEQTPFDSRRERAGERTAFCALSFASSLDSAGLSTRQITRRSIDPRRRMDKLCTARVYMPYKECTVRSGRERESAASPPSPGDAPHAVSASNTAQSAPSARAAARPSLSTCKATGEATSTGCWRDAECRRRLFLFISQATNSYSYLRRRLLIFDR
jgi:hypothetical protein